MSNIGYLLLTASICAAGASFGSVWGIAEYVGEWGFHEWWEDTKKDAGMLAAAFVPPLSALALFAGAVYVG